MQQCRRRERATVRNLERLLCQERAYLLEGELRFVDDSSQMILCKFHRRFLEAFEVRYGWWIEVPVNSLCKSGVSDTTAVGRRTIVDGISRSCLSALVKFVPQSEKI